MALLPTTILDKDYIAALVRPRDPKSHKGTHGHALIIAGNTGRMGAAVLSARACLRTGAGLLTVCVPADERSILQVAVPEAMLTFREQNKSIENYSAIGIGPALGLTKEDGELLLNTFAANETPLVLDADALTLLSRAKENLSLVPAGAIFTPHPKEFDRLFGESPDEDSRRDKAVALSASHPWIIVLKGHRTIVAASGNTYTNTTGNAGLAKAGSGDVLTGMITALLAQGNSGVSAACAGVFLHGLAADIALKKQSPESMLASDVIENIGYAFGQLHG